MLPDDFVPIKGRDVTGPARLTGILAGRVCPVQTRMEAAAFGRFVETNSVPQSRLGIGRSDNTFFRLDKAIYTDPLIGACPGRRSSLREPDPADTPRSP